MYEVGDRWPRGLGFVAHTGGLIDGPDNSELCYLFKQQTISTFRSRYVNIDMS